jgi:hypothetical protein
MTRIAVYKALYRLFGGFIADVVAAIDQVCAHMVANNRNRFEDGVAQLVILLVIFLYA